MLKRLELVGFKSFAEKTQFDFGAGITAIVGPNGSGKSNVVDAVRWILGEQSAKSLRGGEMADVIFNGSSTRRSLGLAEVTLTLDNSKRQLGIEADEVQVTRRVYRSGEGEYLINKQPARLKDIKEMFLGSGAGADAYCIIAQGRVEAMLQSSTKDRRTIFEEAAGISRFKAKKTETLRKLEHTDQNLQRLRDIIEEVDRQLKNVKLQAAKAQRYQECTGRLKELRVALTLEEYHHLSQQLVAVQASLGQLSTDLEAQLRITADGEKAVRRLDLALTELDQQSRAADAALADSRQRISMTQATLQHERQSTVNLEEELANTRTQAQRLAGQINLLATTLTRADVELAEANAACAEHAQVAARADEELAATNDQLARLRKQAETDKAIWMEQLQLAAKLHNEQVSFEAQISSLQQHRRRLENRAAQATASLQQLDSDLHQLQDAETAVQGRLGGLKEQQAGHRQEREATRQTAEATARRLVGLREERSALSSRIEVLEALERSQEGLGAGVKEVLGLAAGEADPIRSKTRVWASNVLGLVADLLSTSHEHAPLIDLALGERAQSILCRDAEHLTLALEELAGDLPGRVTFLPFDPERRQAEPSGLAPQHPGIVAPASSLVSCTKPKLGGLVEHLLGCTLIVRNLAAARSVCAQFPGYRCLTLAGELLECDGTLTVGQHHAASGILSRKSELRSLRDRISDVDDQVKTLEAELGGLRDLLARLDSADGQLQQEIQVLADQAADLRSRLQQQRQRHEGLAEEVALGTLEVKQLDKELGQLQQSHAAVLERAQHARQLEARHHDALQAAEAEAPTLEQQRHSRQEAATAARVALAKTEQRREAVISRHEQVRQDVAQRQQEQQRARDHLAVLLGRLEHNQLALLQTTELQAQAFLAKEHAEAASAVVQTAAAAARVERTQELERTQASRQKQQALQEQVHTQELAASDHRHRLDTLSARLREEHELELAALYHEYQQPEQALDHAAAQNEIADLRKKITRLGSVSLDALQELQELETRAGTLQTQHDDLMSAKTALEEIIGKINNDSRKLFSEMLDTVRTHFQELFRKLFGGGMADIVLEDATDILESGIEIIARPPGKELRSISLLSGGEKTLTAVALLLAIFRSKPSPFCILDEVDAALDEANTGRFASVLREFLDRSQFIMITHSKKTMAMADVLYGITMQEAGVSKRVAVRLDEWPETAAA